MFAITLSGLPPKRLIHFYHFIRESVVTFSFCCLA